MLTINEMLDVIATEAAEAIATPDPWKTKPAEEVGSTAVLAGASRGPQKQPSSVGWWWWIEVCWTPEGMKQLAMRVDVIERDGALWVGTEDCRDTEPTYERATLKGGWWFAEAVERSAAPANYRTQSPAL